MRVAAFVVVSALAAGGAGAQDDAGQMAAVQAQQQMMQQALLSQQITQQQQQLAIQASQQATQQAMLASQQAMQQSMQAAADAGRWGGAGDRGDESAGVVASEPTFWPRPDAFPDSATVTLSDDTPGAMIFYTLDGTYPTARSARYTGPIRIDRTTTIRATAIAPDFGRSRSVTGTYVIGR